MDKDKISIIIPILNRKSDIRQLTERIDAILKMKGVVYEIIFIGDRAGDHAREIGERLFARYPVSFFLKKGEEKGKAFSLLEGFKGAKYDLAAVFDADSPYPPEAFLEMISKIKEGFDIIVAEKQNRSASFFKKIINRGFSFFFLKILHGLDFDAEFGMILFKKKILKEIFFNPAPRIFGLEFSAKARFCGYRLGSVKTGFNQRGLEKSAIDFLKALCRVGIEAIKLKFERRDSVVIPPREKSSMIGAGLAFAGTRYVTHTTLNRDFSAAKTFINWQRNAILAIGGIFIFGLALNPIAAGIALVGVLSAIYFLDALFNLYLGIKSLSDPPEIKSKAEELNSLRADFLPVYSILCPLYKEAHMLPVFLKAIDKIDWPKNKLDVLLLLEENDRETIASARAMVLPEYVRILIVPDSLPKTKPKACNFGLSFAKGEFVVIYDAEDIPEPQQLKKAYLGFQKVPRTVGCLQAKLNYFNPDQNFLTKLFTAEYSLWFDVILPGLQSLNTSIPLGGTSNHFRTKDLIALEGWDPFNVTEDCDLGVRLFKKGYQTTIIDSVTLEEANSDLKNWLRQRSRWIKGYMQTYLVHMRHPVAFFKENGAHALIFQLVVGGKTAFVIINPILWLATFSYFAFYGIFGAAIEKLYPAPIFYMAAFSLVFGNFIAIYYYMIGCAKREQWWLVKYVFFVPFYWALMSAASLIALFQIVARPYFWEKTNHGLSFKKTEESAGFLSGIPKLKNNLKKRIAIYPIKEKTAQSFFSGKNILAPAILFSGFSNFIFNAFLGRVLNFEALSLVAFVNTLWFVIAIFISAFSSTINHKIACLFGKRDTEAGLSFLRSITKKGLKIVIPFSLVWLAAAPFLSHFFYIEDYGVLALFAPVLVFALILAANSGYLSGNQFFGSAAIIIFSEAAAKLLSAAAFYYLGMAKWVYLSILFSVVFSSLVSMAIIFKKARKTEEKKDFAFPKSFFTASVLTNISSALFLSLDILLAKHFLPPPAAGEYALLSLIGKMVYFFGFIPNAFMLTFVGQKMGKGENPKKVFQAIYLAVFVLTFAGFLIFGVFGEKTIPLLFGAKALKILPYAGIYAISLAFFTLANTILNYHLAVKEYYFAFVSLFFSLAMGFAIVIFHSSAEEIVRAVFWINLGGWAAMGILHYLGERVIFIQRGFTDLIGVFSDQLFASVNNGAGGEAKKILIFNWRDTKHEFAGGAEVYIYEMAKNWIREGCEVTVFCGNDSKALRSEIIDGVKIIRRGGFYLVYVWAFIYYMLRFRGKYNIIIDCQNGIPFFTPLYAREPVYCLMHHVHQEVFRKSLAKPLAFLAMILEKNVMPLVYAKIPFITVSESSKKEIEALGLGKAGVSVVNPGIDLKNLIPGKKSEQPLVLYLGRLKAYKSIEVLIRAFHFIAKYREDAVLVIAGGGEEEAKLKKLAADLFLDGKRVKFTGRISDAEKISLLQKAWVLVNPSFMEGWGIAVIEANACGTPVIASNVSGLCDSVKNGETGYLADYGDIKDFARCLYRIIFNEKVRRKMNLSARLWAENFDWKKSSDFFLGIIESRQVQSVEAEMALSKNNL